MLRRRYSLPMAAAGAARRGTAASALPLLGSHGSGLAARSRCAPGRPRAGSAPRHVTRPPVPPVPAPWRAPGSWQPARRTSARCHGHRQRASGRAPALQPSSGALAGLQRPGSILPELFSELTAKQYPFPRPPSPVQASRVRTRPKRPPEGRGPELHL